MGEKVSRQELLEATRACLEASEAVRTFFDKYVTFWWAESGEPPPEPKAVVTAAIFDEWRELKAKEEEARQEWERKLRGYVGQGQS